MSAPYTGPTATTDSPDAAAAVARATASLLARRSDTMSHIATALEHDPACAMAHVLDGLMVAGVRKASLLPKARASLTAAEAQRERLPGQERRYLDALAGAVDRNPDRAVSAYEAIVTDDPHDLLALTMAQGELFWTGDMARSHALSTQAALTWSERDAGYADWLALRAFDLEEAGELDAAEAAGREAVSLDGASLWGAHAVAHVLEMRGDAAGGVVWLNGLHDAWLPGGPMKFHLWWHRALCHIELGEHDAALALHDAWLRNDEQPLQRALPDFYLDVQNGASNLLRLELAGVDVGDRWQAQAASIDVSWEDLSNPFTTLHVAMTLEATGQLERTERLLASTEALVATGSGSLADAYRDAPAMLRAIASHRAGRHDAVVSNAMPIRGALWRMGGSHAQRDVLFQLLFDSARRCGRDDLQRTILADLERIGFIAPAERSAYAMPTGA